MAKGFPVCFPLYQSIDFNHSETMQYVIAWGVMIIITFAIKYMDIGY